jgi:uncharacterized membrane protein YuzA (DUF378 family)
MMSDDNPFHKHSTLLGFLGAAVVVSIAGTLTHWNESLLIVDVVAGLAGLWVFSRLFYGFKASRVLDNPDETPSPVIGPYDRWRGTQSENERLVQAYKKFLEGDSSEFERLAQAQEEETT